MYRGFGKRSVQSHGARLHHYAGMRGTALTPQEVREIAVRAYCDPRTVRAYLNGRNQHSTTSKRIERAIVELQATPRTTGAKGEAL
jgi:hypothetical protein